MIQYSDKYVTIKVKRSKDSIQPVKPTKNLICPEDSSGSMTDKEINPSPEGADLNLQWFNLKHAQN